MTVYYTIPLVLQVHSAIYDNLNVLNHKMQIVVAVDFYSTLDLQELYKLTGSAFRSVQNMDLPGNIFGVLFGRK